MRKTLTILSLVLVSGCGPMAHYDGAASHVSGPRLAGDNFEWIVPGTTPKSAVVEKLGQPALVLATDGSEILLFRELMYAVTREENIFVEKKHHKIYESILVVASVDNKIVKWEVMHDGYMVNSEGFHD